MKDKITGFIRMLEHENLNPVQYYFCVVNGNKPSVQKSRIPLNPLIGSKIRLEFSGEIQCVDCGKPTKKTFGGGSCYNCFQSLASNDFCILKPSGCHFHLGTCREPKWGQEHCFKSHIVYLANTTGIKVGITKENPHSKRWVDQGAIEGLPIVEVSNRKDSGIIEDNLGKLIPDKSSWQKLISSDSEEIDLIAESNRILSYLDLKKLNIEGKILSTNLTRIKYPISRYPSLKKSLKPEPGKNLESILLGIKGQYLLFEEGGMNIRSLEGYSVKLYFGG